MIVKDSAKINKITKFLILFVLKFVNVAGFEPAQLSTLELLLTQSVHHSDYQPDIPHSRTRSYLAEAGRFELPPTLSSALAS